MLFLYGTKDLTDVMPFLAPTKQLGKKLQQSGISDLCFLQTCHRWECYWYSEDLASLDRVKMVISDNQINSEKFYQKFGPAAIGHLFRISSGLDTLILGEYEILGQIRENLKSAQNEGSCGEITNLIFQEALLLGKRVRRETKISWGKLAYASIVLDLVGKIDLGLEPDVLLIGSGKLAREIGTVLCKEGFRLHIVAGRDRMKAETLAGDLGGECYEAKDLAELIGRFRIVIGASGAKQPLVTMETLNNLQYPLTIIDLSVPPIIQRDAALNPFIKIIGFDEIEKLSRTNLEGRTVETPKVELLIAAAVEDTLIGIKQRQKHSQIESAKESLLHEGSSLLSGILARIDDENIKKNVSQLWNRQLQKMVHLALENEKQENLEIKGGVSRFFPIILSLKEQRILVVGGGKVAARKIGKLLEADAQIEVVAPDLIPELEALARDKKIIWKKMFYQTQLLNGVTIVIAATSDSELNRRITVEARERRILVNTVNQAVDSDFIFPAQIRRGDLLIAISTSGTQPALARKIREEMELLFETADNSLLIEKEMKLQ